MIILKNRNNAESTLTYIASFLIALSIVLIYNQVYFLGIGLLVLGICLFSIQKKTFIHFKDKMAIARFTLLSVPIPLWEVKYDLENFHHAVLYQYSEKGTVQFRVQSVRHQKREYWIKLLPTKGKEIDLGFENDYKLIRNVLLQFKTELQYDVTDSIQEKMLRNKIERENRLNKRR